MSPAISTNALTKTYRDATALDRVYLVVPEGSVYGLVGPNGAGKTTTFSMIAGFVNPSKGSILLNGKEIIGFPPHQRAREGIVYLAQESSVFRSLSVEDNIRAIAQTLTGDKIKENEIVSNRLQELGLTSLAKQKAHSLSGGERRRLEIARALVLSPDFLLLDEPFSGVDPKNVTEVNRIITDLKDQGMGILLTDHNVRETLRAVDRAYLLYEGHVLAHGDADFLISDPETRKKYLGENFEV